MEKIIRIILFIITILMADPCPITAASKINRKTTSTVNWSPVMDAIIKVESEGKQYAQSGNSVGVMQITPILVAECNRIFKKRKSKKRFKLSDRFSIAKSKEMFLLIQSYYNPKNSIEKAIRSWNGGVHFSVRQTQRYFEKVMRVMK